MSPGKTKARLIKGAPPTNKIFIPSDKNLVPNQKEVIISVAEWEALRLCDLENYKQRDAAKEMCLSQPTINRLLSKAHFKIVEALNNGYVLKFEEESLAVCSYCHEKLSTKNFSKTLGSIVCPNCKNEIDLD